MGGSAFASLSGAVSDTDSSVLLHFGQPMVEQRALEQGGVVLRGDRSVLQLTGGDRLTWLDSVSSQALGSLQPGDSAETLILDPHGHIEQVLQVVDDGSATWLLVNSERAQAAFDWLNRMRFRLDVQIANLSSDWMVVTEIGDAGLDWASHGWLAWRDPWPNITAGGYGYGAQALPWQATDWIVPRAAEAELVAEFQRDGVAIAGQLAWQALRIAAGRPDATDIDERSLPHEFDWLRTAVHLNKGCYRGQETVAKVHNLGRPPRRLVLLHLDGSDSVLPQPGDAVWASRDGEPREVGHVIAAAQHFELGPTALALIKRAVPSSLELTVHASGHEIAASQQELVPSDAGPAVDIPRLPRLGIRT